MASELLPLSIGTSQMEIRVQKAYCDPSFGNIDILSSEMCPLDCWLDSAYYTTTLAVSVSSSCCHQKSPQY